MPEVAGLSRINFPGLSAPSPRSWQGFVIFLGEQGAVLVGLAPGIASLHPQRTFGTNNKSFHKVRRRSRARGGGLGHSATHRVGVCLEGSSGIICFQPLPCASLRDASCITKHVLGAFRMLGLREHRVHPRSSRQQQRRGMG